MIKRSQACNLGLRLSALCIFVMSCEWWRSCKSLLNTCCFKTRGDKDGYRYLTADSSSFESGLIFKMKLRDALLRLAFLWVKESLWDSCTAGVNFTIDHVTVTKTKIKLPGVNQRNQACSGQWSKTT